MSDPDMPGNKPSTDEPEFSPEALAAFGKARRSFGFAMGIMLLGFMAIGVAIVYRVMRDAPSPTVVEAVTLPAGAQVVSAINVDGTIQITSQAAGVTTLSVFAAETGELLRSVTINVQ